MAGAARASHDLCLRAIDEAARASGVPRVILHAIARVETGRGSAGEPWPWSVNIEGRDRIFDNSAELKHFAQSALAAGKTSFDLGCFQINYRWHNEHFNTLDDMISPIPNALYAADFLTRLYREKGDWEAAAAAYHSRTPEHAERYLGKFREQIAALNGDTQTARLAPPRGASTRAAPARGPNRFPLLQTSGGGRAPGSLVPLANR